MPQHVSLVSQWLLHFNSIQGYGFGSVHTKKEHRQVTAVALHCQARYKITAVCLLALLLHSSCLVTETHH